MKATDPMKALERAISICGTQAELALRVASFKENPKIKQAHVWNWLNRDKQVPADCVLAVENATRDAKGNAQVTRHELRPDLYPVERVAA